MGYGPVINGKQKPITPWEKSWAYQEERKREKKANARRDERRQRNQARWNQQST